MSEELGKLQEIGAQKINDKTHIPVEHVQAILHESFEGFTKVQFLGFLSILERDYDLDMSKVRSEGLKFFEEKMKRTQTKGVFMPQPQKKKLTSFYVVLISVVFLLVLYMNFGSSDETNDALEVDSSLIMDVQKSIVATTLVETNASNIDANLTQEDENKSVSNAEESKPVALVEEKASENSLKISTEKKLWLGYIDRTSGEKFNKTFSGELDLDSSKEWLLFFGHRFAKIALSGETHKVESEGSVRFLYKDGVLKPLSAEEFKELNKGKEW